MSEHGALGKYSQKKIEQLFILKSLLKLTSIELKLKKKARFLKGEKTLDLSTNSLLVVPENYKLFTQLAI